MTVTIANEDSKYLAAVIGGRAITRALAAKVEEIRANLAEVDDFVTVGAEITYHPRTGRLVVIRDDRDLERYDIECPPDGYWGGDGYRIRNIGAYPALILRNRSNGSRILSAEGMFDWPIYRAALNLWPPMAVPRHEASMSPYGPVPAHNAGVYGHECAQCVEEK